MSVMEILAAVLQDRQLGIDPCVAVVHADFCTERTRKIFLGGGAEAWMLLQFCSQGRRSHHHKCDVRVHVLGFCQEASRVGQHPSIQQRRLQGEVVAAVVVFVVAVDDDDILPVVFYGAGDFLSVSPPKVD